MVREKVLALLGQGYIEQGYIELGTDRKPRRPCPLQPLDAPPEGRALDVNIKEEGGNGRAAVHVAAFHAAEVLNASSTTPACINKSNAFHTRTACSVSGTPLFGRRARARGSRGGGVEGEGLP
jgi:hypothetical protein